MKKLNIIILAMIFSTVVGFGQANPTINILMQPASLSLYTNGILRVNTCNLGNTPIVSNSLRIIVTAGPNAEIIGIQAGSDPRYTITLLDPGAGNTIHLVNTNGTIGVVNCLDINLIVKGKVVSPAATITGSIGYIDANNPLLGGAPNSSQGNASTGDDNSTTSLAVTDFLPIKLESFNANLVDCKSDLTWTTSAEENFRKFEVEMSVDGKNFETVGIVNSKGVSGNGSTYKFKHEGKNGSLYYRLKSVDNNGSYSYSDVINVNRDCDKRKISLYPNPAADVLTVDVINSDVSSSIEAIGVLYNSVGKEVGRYNILNDKNYLDVSKQPSGAYVLKISGNDVNENYQVVIE